jgi:sporulation protein YqfC
MGVENFKERFAEIAELPKDIVMDSPKVTIIGNIQLSIENHRGLIEYGRDKIRVNTSIGIYKITGQDLIIKSISIEEIVMTGKIDNIDISC